MPRSVRLFGLALVSLASLAGCAAPRPADSLPDGSAAVDLASRRDLATAPGADLAVPTLDGSADGAALRDLTAAPPDLSRCSPASCAAPTPLCDPDSGRCVPCLPINNLCPRGAMCLQDPLRGFRCEGQCAQDKDCPAADGGPGAKAACCGLACANLGSDPLHCGACGNSCKGGVCCGGACTDTVTDPMNCGACGRACSGKGYLWVCANSACFQVGCQMGFGDCNKDPADGCEASVAADLKNCGACGRACQANNAVVACEKAACVVKQCNPGFTDCNQDGVDGCEADLQSSILDCGMCGNACPAKENTRPTCKNGVCGNAGCLPGYADCDNNPNTGCEVRIDDDLANCGACNASCQIPHGFPICKAGKCSIDRCSGAWRDCNLQVGDGCETDTALDKSNCGQCGKRCPVNQICGNGVCMP